MFLFSTETWLILASLAVLVWYYYHLKFKVLKDLNIPHDPPGFLGLGVVFKLIKDVDFIFTNDIAKKKRFGPIYGSYFFTTPQIHIHDLEILKQIHIKEFATFPIRQKEFTHIQGDVMKNSLLALDGKHWSRVRNAMTPMFSAVKLRYMLGLLDRASEKLVQNMLEKAKSDGKCDVMDLFDRYTMDAMCATTFSTEANAQALDEEDSVIVKRAREALDISPFANPLVMICLILPWLEKHLAKMGVCFWPKGFMSYFSKLTDSVMEQKASASSDHRTDIMQLMLDQEIPDDQAKTAQKGITRKEIVANSIASVVAGFENSKITLVYLTYNLATHRDCQDRLRKDIREAMEAHEGKLNYDSLNEMKYLTQCVNETLRLQCPIIVNTRLAEKDIEINGLHIPKGHKILVPTWALAHSDEIWDEPEKFNPDRMEDMSSVHPMSFMPWGAGPRNCIGMRLAYMMVKVAIARILLSCEILPTDKTPLPPLALTLKKRGLRPKEELALTVAPLPNESEA